MTYGQNMNSPLEWSLLWVCCILSSPGARGKSPPVRDGEQKEFNNLVSECFPFRILLLLTVLRWFVSVLAHSPGRVRVRCAQRLQSKRRSLAG